MPARTPKGGDQCLRELNRAKLRKDRREIARLAEAIGDELMDGGDLAQAEVHFVLARQDGSFGHDRDRARVIVKEAHCLYERDQYRDSLGRLEEVLGFLGEGTEGSLSARALGLAADLCLRNGRVRRAYKYAIKARALASQRGVGTDALRIGLSLGAVFARLGRWQEASGILEDVLSAARRSGDRQRMGQAYNNLGLVHKNRCEWGRAIDCFEQAIRLARAGPDRSLAERLNNIGIVHFKIGDWKQAEKVWREGFRVARRSEHTTAEASVLLGQGRLEAARGNWERAETRYARALALAEAGDDLRTQALAHEYLTELCLDTGDPEAAAEELEKARKLADRVGTVTDLTAEIRRVQARVASHVESPARALQFITQGLETARRTGDRYEEARFLVLRAELRAREGNHRTGARFSHAIERLSDLGMKHLLARTLVAFAAWMADSGMESQSRDRVQECLIVASEIFEKLGDLCGLADARIALARWKVRHGGVDGALSILRSLEEMNPAPEGVRNRLQSRLQSLREDIETLLVGRIQSSECHTPWDADCLGELSGRIPGELLAGIAANVGADRALWVRPGRAGSDACVLARINMDGNEAQRLAERLLGGEHAWLASGAPVLSVSVSADPRFRRLEAVRNVRSLLLLPLVADGTLQGLIYLDRGSERGFPFGGREMEKISAARPVLESVSMLEEPSGNGGIRIATPSGVKVVPSMLGGAKLARVLGIIGRVCNSSVPILIHGETGTGKELVARALHELGNRHSKAFVAQNCAAIPRDLLESELFGYVSGAFTGAVGDKTGLFESADGGTFFLDEVAEVDAATQVKLLRLLETGEIRRLGAVEEGRVDVRVVSATHRRLDEEVERGRFREDLFYRLNVVDVQLPALRERMEDIPLLANDFLARSFAREGKVAGRLSGDALEVLASYPWPGNVRELENEMKRLGALSTGGSTIQPNMLSRRVRYTRGDHAPGWHRR